jgi:adenylosuccinate lyase
MIPRYTRPAMGQIWTEENKLARWLEVELAAADALAACGEIPAEAAPLLRAHAKPPAPDRVVEIERDVRHDLIAFTLAVVETLPPEAKEAGRWLHYGLTSSDILDTAQALRLRETNELLLQGVERLTEVLKKRAHEFKAGQLVQRSWAQPPALGLRRRGTPGRKNLRRRRQLRPPVARD